jgi:hypothetical protein
MGPRLERCGGEEVDVNSDPRHCGACGVGCDPVFGSCDGGQCGCQGTGMEACGPQNRCEDTQWEPRHCGACGVGCGPGAACVRGDCRCRPGFTLCGGECVDTASDPRHCGGCGTSCGSNACRSGSCQDNNRCPVVGWARCQRHGGVACLENPENDLHCRNAIDFGCGRRCSAGQACRKPGLFDERKCYSVRIGRGCEQCPCDDCDSPSDCEFAPSAVSRVWCIE